MIRLNEFRQKDIAGATFPQSGDAAKMPHRLRRQISRVVVLWIVRGVVRHLSHGKEDIRMPGGLSKWEPRVRLDGQKGAP